LAFKISLLFQEVTYLFMYFLLLDSSEVFLHQTLKTLSSFKEKTNILRAAFHLPKNYKYKLQLKKRLF